MFLQRRPAVLKNLNSACPHTTGSRRNGAGAVSAASKRIGSSGSRSPAVRAGGAPWSGGHDRDAAWIPSPLASATPVARDVHVSRGLAPRASSVQPARSASMARCHQRTRILMRIARIPDRAGNGIAERRSECLHFLPPDMLHRQPRRRAVARKRLRDRRQPLVAIRDEPAARAKAVGRQSPRRASSRSPTGERERHRLPAAFVCSHRKPGLRPDAPQAGCC